MMAQAIQAGQDVTALMGGAAPRSGEDVTSLMSPGLDTLPHFTQSDTSPNELDPNMPGSFLSHLAGQVNPIAAISAIGRMIVPEAAARLLNKADHAMFGSQPLTDAQASQYGPLNTIRHMGAAQGDVYDKAKTAYAKGDYLTAARHFVNYLLPLAGPTLDRSSDLFQAKKWAAGGGDAIGFGLALFGPTAIGRAMARGPHLTPPEPAAALSPREAAVQFGRDRGIPIDAATSTGNRAVQGIQALADRSIGGSVVATRANAATAGALTRVGGELATEAHAVPITAEQAGESLRDALQSRISELHGQANTAYDTLREAEGNPLNAEEIPRPAPLPPDVQAAMTRSIGRVPSPGELQELRRIRAELDALPFVKRTFNEIPTRHGGDLEVTAGAAGAPVYHDIMQHAPGTAGMTRGEVLYAVDKALEKGQFTNAAKGALEVARKRLAGDWRDLSPASLPPDAGAVPGHVDTMLLPVDVRPVKSQLLPLYAQLKREAELVPMQGPKARALVALDRLVNGPDFAPVSVADGALSELKALSRGADLPALRSPAQGIASVAVSRLDAAVRAAVNRAGPDEASALEQGRAATKAKYQVADLLEQLRDEPVQTFRKLTAPQDSGIKLLRQIKDVAPAETDKLARAYLEDRLSLATATGRFEHVDRLAADWGRLGSHTKAILFPRPGQAQALDQFFALAKRLGENPNPSGTAYAGSLLAQGAAFWANPVASIVAQVGAAGLAALLHAPPSLRALTRVLVTAKIPPVAATAARAATVAELVRAAQGVGVRIELPTAAQSTSQPQKTVR